MAIKDRMKGKFWTVEEAVKMDLDTVKECTKHLNNLRIEMGDGQYFTESEGFMVKDSQGRECIDMIGGVAVNAVGANNPEIFKALQTVFDNKVYNFGTIAYHNVAAAFATVMADLSPGGQLTKMGTACGGAEANEAIIKCVKIACRNKPNKTRILAMDNSFHGKTTGAVSVAANPVWKMWQEPLMPNTDSVPFGDVEALEKALKTGEYMAVWSEPFQGEAGVIMPPDNFFPEMRRICDETDTYMVIDEVQMGCGRTGELWCVDNWNVVPDFVTFGKSYTGGLIPMAGFLAKEEAYNAAYGSPETCFHHTATYQENAYSCAAALATLHFLLDNELIEQAEEKGAYFRGLCEKLIDKYPGVLKEVRGKGLIIGFETFEVPEDKREAYGADTFANPICADMVDNLCVETITAINSTTVFRMSPALTIDKETLAEVAKRLEIAVKNAYEAVFA